MTVHIIGGRSYIAGILAHHLAGSFALRHHASSEFGSGDVAAGDIIVNCVWDPELYNIPVATDLAADGRYATIAAKRLGRPEEFGDTCAFLCSAQAGYISGQNLQLDGGSYPGLI